MPDGIDDIDRSALTHAYGPADDIPALLRTAGSPDAARRDPALDELISSLCHQGSIYPATTAAVPFIARLALEGRGGRLRLMWPLHGAAEGPGPEYREVRRAVAVALPALLGPAADEDPAVRRAMVWTVPVCEDASLPLLPLLRTRPAEERDAGVRADLVTALGPRGAQLLPLVEERPKAPDLENRADAAAAIWRVTGRTHDTAQVVADQLARRSHADRPYFGHQPHLGSLRALTAMRLLPAAARTAVEHIAFFPRRVVSSPVCDATPHPDLEARELARGLLALTG
ncbi:hypothetical protein [Streptomyces niveus]|uniref:hypothetical protein n=1 Tax=Streptomyces niveus TaxID=193462 RepID=UPI0034197A74